MCEETKPAAQPHRSEQFDPSKTEADPVLERANELRRKYTDSKPHIVKEGSRDHVIRYDSHGAHCSEPNCEINHFVPDRTIKLEWHDGPEFRKWMASSEIEDAYEAGYIAASRAGAASSKKLSSVHDDKGVCTGFVGAESSVSTVCQHQEPQEWTAKFVDSLILCPDVDHATCQGVVDAHNAALKAEREESERVAQTLYRNIKESQQELASEQHRWADQSNKLYKMIQDRDKELVNWKNQMRGSACVRQIQELEQKLAAERERLKHFEQCYENALKGQKDLLQQLLAAQAANKPLVEELQNIVNCDLEGMRKDFGDDTDRQFRMWAQNRARAALASVKESK